MHRVGNELRRCPHPPGREVGGPSLPFEVGTLARITDYHRFEDGRYALQSVGEAPFRLLRVTRQRPYMRGEIELMSHEVGDEHGLEPLMASVREQLLGHIELLAEMTGQDKIQLDLDVDPASLSYIVATILAVKMPEKQSLLEITRADERLREEASILARENQTLQSFLHLRRQKSRAAAGSGRPAGPHLTQLRFRVTALKIAHRSC